MTREEPAAPGALAQGPEGQDSDDANFSLAGLHSISTMLNHPWRKAPPIHAGSSRFPDVGPPGHVASKPPVADVSLLERYVAQHGAGWDKLHRERALVRARQTPSEPGTSRLPPLSTVPQVFFSADFDLGNPYTFYLVTERYKQTTALGAESDPEALQYGVVLNQMLQEKLSYYLDVIEQHLVVEIGQKSASFFDALATLQQLGTDAETCLTHMDDVGTQLDTIDAHVQDGLHLAELQTERRALEAQQDLLCEVQRLLDRRHLVTLSVQHGEYENALTTMEEIRQALRTDPQLKCITSLHALVPQLDETQAKMTRELQTVLAGLLDTMAVPRASLPDMDLRMCVPPTPLDEVLPSDTRPLAEPAAGAWEPVWNLLERCGGLAAALESYADRIGPLVLDGVAQRLSNYEPASWAVPSATSEQLAALSWEAYVPGLAAFLRALWCLTQHVQGVQATWAQHASPAVAEHLAQATRTMWAAVEQSVVQLMTPRHAQLASVPWDTFVVYHELVWRFVRLAESVAGRPAVALRSCVLAQAKAYLGTQHRQRIERAMRAVEDEVWAPAPVSPDLQATVQRLQDAADGEVSVYLVPHALGGASRALPAASGEPTRQLVVGDVSFFVVKAAGTVIGLLDSYVCLVENVPLFAAETLGWVVELLKQFNSRTCQVVLGAGAMRSAGLKNITARHLALAAQTLSLMMALLPALRACLKRHLTSSQVVLLGDFDKLQRDFREHQWEIHAKLVAIMSDRVHVHCKAMTHVNLSTTPAPSAPIADLVRETGTLHRVMSQYLEPSVVEASVAQVAGHIDTRLSMAISAVDVRSAEAHERLLSDLAYLSEKMKVMYPAWQGEQLQQAAMSKAPKPQLETRRPTGEPLGYKPRRSLGKRPPSTQSPQLESMEAFQQPPKETPAKETEVREPETVSAEAPAQEPVLSTPPPVPAKEAPVSEEAGTLQAEAADPPAEVPAAQEPATPVEAQAPAEAPQAPVEAAPAPTSTPTTAPAPSPGPDAPSVSPVSPTKEGRRPRVSLEQRLAEAAKRRGQQRQAAASNSGPPSPDKTPRKRSLAERLAGAAKAEAREPASTRTTAAADAKLEDVPSVPSASSAEAVEASTADPVDEPAASATTDAASHAEPEKASPTQEPVAAPAEAQQDTEPSTQG